MTAAGNGRLLYLVISAAMIRTVKIMGFTAHIMERGMHYVQILLHLHNIQRIGSAIFVVNAIILGIVDKSLVVTNRPVKLLVSV